MYNDFIAGIDVQGGREMRRRGFTLIEILVVIVVIVILAAILLPVFFKARSKALTNLCSENMKEVSRVVLMYALDNDGSLPNLPQGLSWMKSYNKFDPDYMDNLCCPAIPVSMGKGFGFNLGFDSMPKTGREVKALVWDGNDLKAGFIAPNAGWWEPTWLDYRHKWRTNICFLDGHVKAYPKPSQLYPETAIPASFFSR